MPRINANKLKQAFDALDAVRIIGAFTLDKIDEVFDLKDGSPETTLLGHFLYYVQNERPDLLASRRKEVLHVIDALITDHGAHLAEEHIEPLVRKLREGSRITLGRRVDPQIKSTTPEGYEEENDTSKISFTQPTLLALSGAENFTVDTADSFARFVQRFFGKLENYYSSSYQGLQIVGAHYPKPSTLLAHDIENHNASRYLADGYQLPYIRQLVEKKFLPLVKVFDGERLPDQAPQRRIFIERAMRNARNLTVLAYSFGGVVMDEIGNALYDTMIQLGYTPDEINDVTRQIVVVTMGTVANFGAGKAHFTSLHMLSTRDAKVSALSSNVATCTKDPLLKAADMDWHDTDLKESFLTEAGKVIRIKNIADREWAIVVPDMQSHDSREYTGHPIIGRMIGNALQNSAQNSLSNASPGSFNELPPLQKLLDEAPEHFQGMAHSSIGPKL